MYRPLIVAVLTLAACTPEAAPVAEPVAVVTPITAEIVEETMLPQVDEVVPIGSAGAETAPAADAVDSEEVYATYTLRRGETLAHFARWSEVPVEVIAEASGLDLEGSYPVGTEIRVPVHVDRVAEVDNAREAHRELRVDGYLASRGGAQGTGFHTVRTGETAWAIAQENGGIPVWVLEAYNPSVDLDRLRPGQELMVPVLESELVDAE